MIKISNKSKKFLSPSMLNSARTFKNLNLRKADFEQINDHLQSIDWQLLKSDCTQSEFSELFRLTVLQICELYCPEKGPRCGKKSHPMRNILIRRKKKLKAKIRAITAERPDSPTLSMLNEKLDELHCEIKESILELKNLLKRFNWHWLSK